MLDELKQILISGHWQIRIGKNKNNKHLLSYLKELTNFLPDDCPLVRRKWHILNDKFFIPICKFCENEIYFRSRNNTYSDKCYSCIKKQEQINRESACLEKYGKTSTLAVSKFREKRKNDYYGKIWC